MGMATQLAATLPQRLGRSLVQALLLCLGLTLGAATPVFLAKPYLQLGAKDGAADLTLLWHAPDRDRPWSVALQTAPGAPWTPMAAPAWTRVAVTGIPAHRVYSALLRPLRPGQRFQYRVRLGGATVFTSAGRTPPGPGRPMRVAVTGDLGMGGPEHRALAHGLYRQRPDLVVLPGDLVYQDGRISEYRRHFFPVYNADQAGPGTGAPLLRSTLMVGVLGNHDVGERGPLHPAASDPDAMAYYLYWRQPLNGPAQPGAPPLRPGATWTWDAFLEAAGPRFPTMGTFSFTAGDAHWTVLDSNPYTRWDSPELQRWLEQDLQGAAGAPWRFVVFHHPPFNFSPSNLYQDQWMGRLWPLFQRHRVAIVFTGHIHTYVRTRPLRFVPDPKSLAALDPEAGRGRLTGDLTWDAAFDGATGTRAQDPILIVTGGGGAPLHLKGKAQRVQPNPWVAKHLPDEPTFSILDIRGGTLAFSQRNAAGDTVDQFTLASPAGPTSPAPR